VQAANLMQLVFIHNLPLKGTPSGIKATESFLGRLKKSATTALHLLLQ